VFTGGTCPRKRKEADMRSSIALSYNPYVRLWNESFALWIRIWLMPFTALTHRVYDISVEHFEPHAYAIGDSAQLEHAVTRHDVDAFAFLTGHVQSSRETHGVPQRNLVGRPIAHELHAAAFFGALFGAVYPGFRYLSQTLEFKAPMQLGDVIAVRVELRELLSGRHARFECTAMVGNRIAIVGDAILLLPQ
jgi:3-hydroxybutyryl-CoA dehydratase